MATQTTNYNFTLPGVGDPADQNIWGNQLNGNWSALDTLLKTIVDSAGLPVGAVVPFAGTTAPANHLLCFGQAISRTTYAALFTAVGTTYGAGDGSTTFNVPDLRGRVIAAKDDMGGASANRLTGLTGGVNGDILGGTGGEEAHTLTIPEMPAHNHLSPTGQPFALNGFQNNASRGTGIQDLRYDGGNTTQNTGGGGAHNNIQPTLILNYIIRCL